MSDLLVFERAPNSRMHHVNFSVSNIASGRTVILSFFSTASLEAVYTAHLLQCFPYNCIEIEENPRQAKKSFLLPKLLPNSRLFILFYFEITCMFLLLSLSDHPLSSSLICFSAVVSGAEVNDYDLM